MNDQIYRQIILDHYKNPKNFGEIKNADASASKSNPLCGDQIKVTVNLDKEKKVKDIKFNGVGCSVSKAGGSILTEIIKGKRLEEIKKYTDADFIDDMEVPITPARKKCALLTLDTLRQALDIPKTKK